MVTFTKQEHWISPRSDSSRTDKVLDWLRSIMGQTTTEADNLIVSTTANKVPVAGWMEWNSNDIPSPILKTDEQIDARIEFYEAKFGMSSEDFIKRWYADTSMDTYDLNMWATLIRYRTSDDL